MNFKEANLIRKLEMKAKRQSEIELARIAILKPDFKPKTLSDVIKKLKAQIKSEGDSPVYSMSICTNVTGLKSKSYLPFREWQKIMKSKGF